MSHRLPTKKSLRFFTMVEMITVMIVLGILVTITMSVASVDSTKANSQVIAGAITYANSYALGNTSATDYDGSNTYDQAIQVKIDPNEVTVSLWEESDPTNPTILNTYNLSKGSYIRQLDGSDLTTTKYLYFTSLGEPLYRSSEDEPENDNQITSNLEITVSKKNDPTNSVTVYVRPFTGKVTFYE